MRRWSMMPLSLCVGTVLSFALANSHAQIASESVKVMPNDASPKFEVLSVRPTDPSETGKKLFVQGRRILAVNMNLTDLVLFAYDLNPKQLINTPKWFSEEGFDFNGIPDIEGHPDTRQLKLLIQDALSTRFKLAFHNSKRSLPVYVLTVARGGPKMAETTRAASDLAGFNIGGDLGDVHVTNETMSEFCNGLQSAILDRPVVDHTGLTRRYDFRLRWTPDDSQFVALGMRAIPDGKEDPNGPPPLATALQEQAGLKLEATRAVADVFVVDHVEKPTPN